jgi:hypothetical protein
MKAWGRAAEGYSVSKSRFQPISASLTLQSLQILKEYHNSVRAYKAAIATFPTSNLTPAELKQKTQYEQVMARNQAIIDRPPRDLFEANPDAHRVSKGEKMPWTVAQEMIPELTRRQQQDSSVSIRLVHFLMTNLTDWAGVGSLRCNYCE